LLVYATTPACWAIGTAGGEVIGLGVAADVTAGSQHDQGDQDFTDHRR
jgi:hypothetical protein